MSDETPKTPVAMEAAYKEVCELRAKLSVAQEAMEERAKAHDLTRRELDRAATVRDNLKEQLDKALQKFQNATLKA